MCACRPDSAGECAPPRGRQEWGEGSFPGFPDAPSPCFALSSSILPLFLTSLLWKLRPREQALPQVVVYRTGTESIQAFFPMSWLAKWDLGF